MAKKFVFKRNQSIGQASAELDYHFLDKCFVDTGDLEIVRSCDDQRCILVGRTGAGKSALISQLEKIEDNVITIRPEALALTYIANSNIINFFLEAGVKMDIFYRLLWRHIFVVEVLKAHFHIDSEESKTSFVTHLWALLPKDKKHQRALDYLKEWGDSFWEDTEYRIKEVTKKIEQELAGSIDGKVMGVGGLSLQMAKKLSEEQKAEVVNQAQEVVNQAQVRELFTIIELLEDTLINDPQKKYFIAIDRLDEDWTTDNIKYRLIRALIETTFEFAKVRNVKIIVVLRVDLIDRVFRFTRDTGFQEEKFRTSMLHLSWSRDNLVEILDTRINELVREQYTTQKVTHRDFLPAKIFNQNTIDYMLARTHYRPRDLIQFFNKCIYHADGQARIEPKIIRDAEGAYSRERIRALADEWFGLYPNIIHLAKLLKGKKESFTMGEISNTEFDDNCLELLISGEAIDGVDKAYMD